MVKAIRIVIIALVFHGLVAAHADAKEASCRSALDRCIAQCERYPGMFAEGCSVGCWLSYLTCD